ncbi:conjugative relaxase domain-containing protein, TrwC/TraI family [Micromonospora nigra]|uniref:Conjugative relaxase domain-containing protein, TrwC/TraI family n=1 Tax=Micromonospora nigra TaxID=145857 RepID=A0A1C6RL65_9ACTN|nr:MobF family relaxase [Micromonospora nigra]SCL17774.1 conjugative relaxase domain-containing protein, TrwC/TraI family [Micromonospora nigra]
MLSISSGHSAEYLYGQVAGGRESYYLDATTDGEAPGRWWGGGADKFGLTGEVAVDDMEALYGKFLDPRDARWSDPATRASADRLGRAPGRYRRASDILNERVTETYGIDASRLTEMRHHADASDDPTRALRDALVDATGALPEDITAMMRQAERAERQPVAFLDLTFSPVKSVTVLHTAYSRMELDAQRAGDDEAAQGWASKRRAVEEAVWEGNQAMLRHMTEQAGYSRVGRHGAGGGRWIDAPDWTVASFFQTTSRDLDPQLHIHNAVLNRVVCADGEVRTLDSQAIHRHKQGAGTIGERVMEEALATKLGVRWQMRADGTAREVVGVDQEIMDMFSTRTAKITKKLAEKISRFREQVGRDPNSLEIDRLRRQASMATRRAKTHEGETKAEQLDRWAERLHAKVVGGLHRVAQTVGGHTRQTPAEAWSPSGVIAEAVAACQQAEPTFDRSKLIRQILLALPDNLGGLTPEQVNVIAEQLADQALSDDGLVVPVTGRQVTEEVPDELKVANGRSSYASPAGMRYAMRDHVVAEQALRRAAVRRGAHTVPAADVDAWLADDDMGRMLGDDQAAAVRSILTSGAVVSVLSAPAGTGKSFTVGAVSKALADLDGGRLFGLATSQIATEVLADDGVTAMNTTRWLAAQDRLASGKATLDDMRWALNDNDIVVVDEASMVDTDDMNRIREYVEHRKARLLLAGDPRQLASVGAGGGMEMLTDGCAQVHTLAEVRRFKAGWEADASLRLRDGDVSVLDEYDRRGRIVDCGTLDAATSSAARAYLGDTLAGLRSLVVCPTNEAASAVSATIRDQLVSLGRVTPEGVLLDGDCGNTAGVGDVVMARRNNWAHGLVNRRRYVVEEVNEDGSLRVTLEGDPAQVRTVPAAYVREHVVLGYAGTVHAAQGVTVDTCHGVTDGSMSLEGQYVAMTRGRQGNTMHVATYQEGEDTPTGETHGRGRRDASAVLGEAFDRDAEEQRAALSQGAADRERVASMHTIHEHREQAIRLVCRNRVDGWLDELAADGVISEAQRAAFAADQGTEQLSRQLRVVEQAGHDARAALRTALAAGPLDGARSVAQVVHHRISGAFKDVGLAPAPGAVDLVPDDLSEQWRDYLAELGERAEDRRRELGIQVAQEQPQWAVETLGPLPADMAERMEWEHRASQIAAYREACEFDDQAVVLPPSPGISSTEKRAAWHEAWRAAGRPEAGQEEQDLSDGALRVRVKAWQREQAWAPQFVDSEMRATGRQAAQHRQDAAVLRAQAEVEQDPVVAAQMLAEADEKAALAGMLADVEQDMELAAEARAAWFLEVAATREAAERAQAELAARGRDVGGEDDRVTADEWLAVHAEAMAAEDPHRPVTELDVVDGDQAAEREVVDAPPVVEEVAAGSTVEVDMPAGVPTAAEAAAAVAAARLALAEVADRRSAEAAHAQAEAEQEARQAAWQAEQAADAETQRQREREPDLAL